MLPFISDRRLEPIADKVFSGRRLTFEDGLVLYGSHDLITIGQLANHVREQQHGNKAYYNINRHINPTNVCVKFCRLCAYGRGRNEKGAYTMALGEVLEYASRGFTDDITEFHIVGGLHPDLPFEYYVDIIRALHQRFPTVHLKAFTMVEIDWLAKLSGKSIEEVIEILKEAGVGSFPGGGAEIFNSRVRKIICTTKISGHRWLQIAKTAHRLGVRSNATMLYGHVETDAERVEHLFLLRQAQDETGGFMTFIPLAFHPDNTPLDYIRPTTGFMDLKNVAIARLILDNFPHIKSYWIQIGPKLAQVSLSFGADDMDGTIIEERITHSAGAQTALGLTRDTLVGLIRQTGRIPVERDTVYKELRVAV
ncbi:MAG: aminofutalosine synthase MqnE [Acidobacteria bacterium]|nr:aminofutalosine synthase MqnE [Acidobacteriota bacterium]